MTLPDILQQIATAKTAYYPVINADEHMTGIFSINDIRRILNDDATPRPTLARNMSKKDMATHQVIFATPDQHLTEVMKKLTSRNLEEIPVVDPDDHVKVLFMLSRRTLLAHYAEQVEETRNRYQDG